jgi:hypothetical protein
LKATANLRPVFGILGEPLRGSLTIGGEQSDKSQYVPYAHVQFLQQASIRVVPVDYTLDKEDLYDLLDELSGIYICGDSSLSLSDPDY